MCGLRAAPTKAGTTGQHVILFWSDDEGRSWSDPAGPFVPPTVDGKPGLFRALGLTPVGGERVLATLYWVDHSDPSLPFFNEQTQGLLDSRIFFSESIDRGATWSAPRQMDRSPFDVPTPITGPVLVLPNGEWACQFELNKHYHDTSVWRHSSVLMFSRDGGRSWPEHVIVSNDPANRVFYWDQRPGVLADGRILDLFWTYDNEAGKYLNIHARVSPDCGRTWSPIWDTGVAGQPAAPVQLPDGRIVMVYVDRTGPPAIKARVSTDGGRGQPAGWRWPEATELAIHETRAASQTRDKSSMEDAWAEMAAFSVGLPATALLPGGQRPDGCDVLVVYYAGPETDRTDIQWARIRME